MSLHPLVGIGWERAFPFPPEFDQYYNSKIREIGGSFIRAKFHFTRGSGWLVFLDQPSSYIFVKDIIENKCLGASSNHFNFFSMLDYVLITNILLFIVRREKTALHSQLYLPPS